MLMLLVAGNCCEDKAMDAIFMQCFKNPSIVYVGNAPCYFSRTLWALRELSQDCRCNAINRGLSDDMDLGIKVHIC